MAWFVNIMLEVFLINFVKLLVSVQLLLEWSLTTWGLRLYVLFLEPAMGHRFVRECKTKWNKTDVLWEDIEQTAKGVMESEKKLQYVAALLALNRSAAFCIMQKARIKWEMWNIMFHLYKHSERFSLQRREMCYVTVSLYIRTFIIVSHINISQSFPYCSKH